MNTFPKLASCIAAAALATAAHAAPPTVNAEQGELDVDITAKILKEKAKRNPGAMQAGNSGGGSGSSNCGSVNINSTEKDKKSSGGIADMMGKQSTTVVLGPVINMANCK